MTPFDGHLPRGTLQRKNRLQCRGRRELAPPSWPTSISPFAKLSDGMCLHPPLCPALRHSLLLQAACGSPNHALKHSWPAPGLSASAENGIQLACLADPCVRSLTVSSHLVDRLIGPRPSPRDQQLRCAAAARLHLREQMRRARPGFEPQASSSSTSCSARRTPT